MTVRSLPLSLLALFLTTGLLAPPAHARVAPPLDDSTTTAPEPASDREAFDPPSWRDVERAVWDHTGHHVGLPRVADVYSRESLVHRAPPAFRYNRVEGLVVGIERQPLRLGSDDAARLYGQVGYATALRDIRYTVGLESQLYHEDATGLKLGARYEKQTVTPDRWKTSWAENSLIGIGFEYDFFDYYEAEGLTVYAEQTLPRTVRLTVGARVEEHRTLTKNTDWSVFETGRFRTNPAVDEGRLNAAFASLRAGRLRDLNGLPSGAALRLSVERGSGIGDAGDYVRAEGDARGFLRLTDETRLGLRLRGGLVTSDAPVQTQFTLGGIGSVRSFEQNAFRGARMLLANAEYIIDGATVFDDVLDDLFVVGFADVGWTGDADTRFRTEDVLPSAGFGIGLDERSVRLDVSWPLRDVPGAGSGPSIWLRFTPTF
jgi:hypothetical protein